MPVFDADAQLTLADRVLADLAPRGGMYVARRAADGDAESMVIQTGEEGRFRIGLPDLASTDSTERFITDAQVHLECVFKRPLPRCPAHGHGLRAVVGKGGVWWTCPDGGWRCELGDYDDHNWPPAPEERPSDVLAALTKRFARRHITGWQQAGPSEAARSVRITVWPVDESMIEQMRRAADPITLEVRQGSAPLTREEVQAGVDHAHEQDVRWAHWAVECWSGFPVAQQHRPLVFTGPQVRIDGGFRSGKAKLGFLAGMVDSAVALPDRILALLVADASPPDTLPKSAVKIFVTAARLTETEFQTDRGPRTLPAWQLQADGVNGSLWVADPELNPAWEPDRPPRIPPPGPGSRRCLTGALLGADQRTLTVSFVGAPAARMAYEGGEIVESNIAVTVVPYAASIGYLARWHTAVGARRQVTARLSAPLGARVLVDLNSAPVETLPAD